MDHMTSGGKVIRAPSLKRGKDDTPVSERVKLDRILGVTVSSNAAIDCDPNTGVIAYPAGCVVVLFNPKKNRHFHFVNNARKAITSVGFSTDGRYLVTGECGHLPSVRVWDVAEKIQIGEFSGHKYGVNCVAFSPNLKYVVSVGTQHDMVVNVWDWKAGVKVASNKVSTKVKAIAFAENGSYFVTVGNRHVKFWYLEYSRSAKYKEVVPLMGRSAILGEQRNNYFCDVACGRGEMGDSTYAITRSGLLCEFNNRRLLDKWVELRTTSANSLAVGEEYVFVGCADGIVRCFSPFTLQFVTTLPRTHYLGVDVARGLSISHMASHPPNARYPDTVAVKFDEQNHKVTCVYNDHSVYIWDVHDIKRVGKSHSFLYHSACIWGIEMYPELGDHIKPVLPPGSFVTCSSDDTIRVWNFDPNMPTNTLYRRNIYSTELLKILYMDPDLTYMKDMEMTAGTNSDTSKQETSYDGRNGVRCIKISPDGKHLASGDRAGNIRIHELQFLDEVCKIEAHDAEVLCLEYTTTDSGRRLLASASRDRLIHVFNVDQDYNFIQTLDDHSSSITAVRFLFCGNQLQMVSCGADKSIIFRQLQQTAPGTFQFSRGHNVAGKTTLYDMEVDFGQKHVLTACQDRNVRVYKTMSGKHTRTFKGTPGEDGSLIKVVLDSSGIYAVTSSTDKTLGVYDYYSGEFLASMTGHSEIVTGLRFSPDGRRIVSASGDSCTFVWRVPHDMVVTMQARTSQQTARATKRTNSSESNNIRNSINVNGKERFGSPPAELLDPNANGIPSDEFDYRFSDGQLPLWAKKQITDVTNNAPTTTGRQIDFPKGRWAQRIDASGITVKTVYDSDSVIPFPLTQDKKSIADSDGSKDSSLDSGTEVRQYSDFRRETIINNKQVSIGNISFRATDGHTESSRIRHLTDDSSIGSCRLEDLESTEHDGDVEDYSEGEGESTEAEQPEKLMYYPPTEDVGSNYTVNAMDVEELRRSQRLHRKTRPERLTDLPTVTVSPVPGSVASASISGSQDSDDDEEGASTPSAETAERNIMAMLSVSTESLDQLNNREKFLKSTFESLSGLEDGETVNHVPSSEKSPGTSISSQFLGRSSSGSVRNVSVIQAAIQVRYNSETSRKREELHKRIEETRRKLQSIGYRSSLKSSQSITDLSNIPEKDTNTSSRHRLHSDDSDAPGGLRRACSLSDLSAPSPRRLLPNTPLHVSGKLSSTSPRQNAHGSSSRGSSTMMRSNSVGILNQSDSEADMNSVQRSATLSRMGNLPSSMRPTIASQNKSRRRSLAMSTNDLRGDDSSSEEAGSVEQGRAPRSASTDRISQNSGSTLNINGPGLQRRGGSSRNGSERDLSRGAREVTQRLSQHPPTPPARSSKRQKQQLDPSPQDPPVKDIISTEDMSLSLPAVKQTTARLIDAANSFLDLHRRLNMDKELPQNERVGLLQFMSATAAQTQTTMQLISSPSSSLVNNNSDVSLDMTSLPPAIGGQMVHMMQQYSDMFLSLMQQMVTNPADKTNEQPAHRPS